MEIVFCNDGFAAVDKPAGWLSVPSRMGAADPRPCAGIALQERLGERVWPVHRLDVEVSGLLLFARSAAAHRAAGAWFETRRVRKAYDARTEGEGAGLQAGRAERWRSLLLRGKRRSYESPRGREAVTAATFLGRAGPWLAWRLEPLTGRRHQLRVHLASRGFPVAGDALYGAAAPWPAGGIGLRSVALDFSGCADAPGFGLPPRLEVAGLEPPPAQPPYSSS